MRAGYIFEAGVIDKHIFANLTKSLQSGKGHPAFSEIVKARPCIAAGPHRVLSPFGLFLLADRESVGHPTGVVESQGVVQMVFEDGDVSEKRLLPLGEAFGCFLFDSGESIFAGFQQYSSTLCTPRVYDVAIADIQLPESLEYLYAFFVGRYCGRNGVSFLFFGKE